MIEIWSWAELVAQSDNPNDSQLTAVIQNETKSDAFILHVSYVKGSEDGITIIPTALETYAIGEYPIQRMVNGALVNILFSLTADGQYTLPIPMAKAWEHLKLHVEFTGDTSNVGSVYIAAIQDYHKV